MWLAGSECARSILAVPRFADELQRSAELSSVAQRSAALLLTAMQDEANPGQDREARILARRKRIEEQLGAKAGDGGEQGRRKKEEAAAEESRSKVQISDTRGKIDKIKTAGHAEVTTIRIVGDSRENERRINEEVNRQGRRQKLLYEAESSAPAS